MKTSVSSKYFAWSVICFVMVFSSCDATTRLLLGEPPKVEFIGPESMRPGETYKFEGQAEDPDGDPLTYRWSATNLLDEEVGRFSSTTGTVVSYTPPESGSGLEAINVRVTVSDGTYEIPASVIYFRLSGSVWKPR